MGKLMKILEIGLILGGYAGMYGMGNSVGKSAGKLEERREIVENAKMQADYLREFVREKYGSLTMAERQERLTSASALEYFADSLSWELCPEE